jgi:hypothetical protein
MLKAAIRNNSVIIGETAVPFIVAPTGTMANNGAITLGTALATTYSNAFIMLPAGAIAAGVPAAASWLFVQMSSTTAGTVFNNTYTSGVPVIPTAPTPFVTTGPGAYTGVTTAQNGVTYVVPGNLMGPNGTLYYEASYQYPNTAGAKTASVAYGGVAIFTRGETTSVSGAIAKKLQNRGVANSQISSDPGGQPGVVLAAVASPTVTAIDTTANQNFIFVLQLATATDFLVMERLFVAVFPG